MTGLELAGILVCIGTLIFGSALFSGLETALFALKPHQLQRLQDNHPALKQFISVFRENPRRVLNVLLLGDGLVKVPLVLLCLLVLWRGPVTRVPQWMIAVGIFAVVVLLCDLIPKLFALSAPYRLSTMGAFTLKISMPVLDRIGHGLESFSTALVGLFTPSQAAQPSPLSDEELETIVEIGEEEGALHEAEAEMIQEIIKLGDKTAKDCMTPRVDAFMLPDDLTNEEVVKRMREKRHRRVPVYVDTPDQVIGILDAKNFLADESQHYT
jgi:putative hemolysin